MEYFSFIPLHSSELASLPDEWKGTLLEKYLKHVRIIVIDKNYPDTLVRYTDVYYLAEGILGEYNVHIKTYSGWKEFKGISSSDTGYFGEYMKGNRIFLYNVLSTLDNHHGYDVIIIIDVERIIAMSAMHHITTRSMQ